MSQITSSFLSRGTVKCSIESCLNLLEEIVTIARGHCESDREETQMGPWEYHLGRLCLWAAEARLPTVDQRLHDSHLKLGVQAILESFGEKLQHTRELLSTDNHDQVEQIINADDGAAPLQRMQQTAREYIHCLSSMTLLIKEAETEPPTAQQSHTIQSQSRRNIRFAQSSKVSSTAESSLNVPTSQDKAVKPPKEAAKFTCGKCESKPIMKISHGTDVARVSMTLIQRGMMHKGGGYAE
ncbi:uncharacterized protein KY384_008589 [Bacidia gigantensis]|uniref:uncharacterized protein n=1 Tax=Bacidia gigantensis TaxID=2732470 RepID=UPI001D03688C|nr:uncharacterized protein KY384_008589 [Bacidia gigantensis]KAG8527159.1 hypothetical protein KY384_008589 [Bacidia gigantensis]